MRHDPNAARFTEFQAELLLDERAHIAETHRFLLRRGHDLIGLCSRAAGEAAEQEAVIFRETLLWQEGAAEGLLIASMAERLAAFSDLSLPDGSLRNELRSALHRLAESAEAVRSRRMWTTKAEPAGQRRLDN